MEQQVDQMITEWLQCMQQVVETEREHGQGSIRLVRLLLTHWRAPKIVEENITQWRARSQILVIPYRTDVVEHQAALRAVVIADDACHTNAEEFKQIALRIAAAAFSAFPSLPLACCSGCCCMLLM